MNKKINKTIMMICAVLAVLLSGAGTVYTRAEGIEYETQAAVPDQEDNYGPDTRGETNCVINAETGEVLLAKNKDRRMYPASTTKVMTALLVLENVPDLNSVMTFTHSAIDIDPSSSTLEPKAMEGEMMTVREALYGLMLKSANECGAMLGEFVGGTEEHFAEMMNARAKEIGAVNTHFMNAYGIHHDEHYTTAYDLALIMREAMKNETFREIAGRADYTMAATNMAGERYIVNSHKMITGDFQEEGVLAGKTGSTPQAGRVLVTAVEREGMYTIATVMGSDIENYYQDTDTLLSYAYDLKADRIRPVEWLPVNDNITALDAVRIRYSASTRGGVCSMLEPGGQLHRDAVYGDWSRVIRGGRYCYVASEFVVSDRPDEIPVTEPYTGTEPETSAAAPFESVTESAADETLAVSGTETLMVPGATSAYDKTDDEIEKSTWKIVLIIIGALVGSLLIAVLILMIINNQRRRRRRKRRR